ncbi:MAG: aminotransferase class I/II-fold pyridoxal phosphate-dependent enzyme [Burkholderiales bacterium]|jgi:aspartate/methionine/tyrosine aminotransferase|nr:aminotransferase class I/II-fold pyridoxal phosphate-dependent enzyme [Burkholderiales bacterium]
MSITQLQSKAILKHAERLDHIEPFHVMRIITRAMELQSSGVDVVNLAVGEPDFPTPKLVVEAGLRALREDRMKYLPALGSDELRDAISKWYRDRYNIEVPANRVAITTGSSAALLLTMGVLVSPGDEILMADPGYPANRHFVSAMNGRAILIPVGPETNYQLTAGVVAKYWTDRTVGVMVASPSNPTGTSIKQDTLRDIHRVVQAKQGTLIVDEIYHGITFGVDACSSLEFADDIFVINSFSKYFAMTGWRLGWAVIPDGFIDSFEKLAQNLFISSPDLAQRAALASFHPDSIRECEAHRANYQEHRDFLLAELRDIGFKVPVEPTGAIYIYADCSKFSNDSFKLCEDLIENAGVAVAPGLDFGVYRANEHIRFSYPKPIPVLAEGVRRIRAHLGR